MRVVTAGKGQVLGVEDAIQGRSHTVGLRCISNQGTLYRIGASRLLQIISNKQNVSEYFFNYSRNRDQLMIEQIRG